MVKEDFKLYEPILVDSKYNGEAMIDDVHYEVFIGHVSENTQYEVIMIDENRIGFFDDEYSYCELPFVAFKQIKDTKVKKPKQTK